MKHRRLSRNKKRQPPVCFISGATGNLPGLPTLYRNNPVIFQGLSVGVEEEPFAPAGIGDSPVGKGGDAVHPSAFDRAGECVSFEWRPTAFGKDVGWTYRVPAIRIYQYDIGEIAGSEIAAPVDPVEVCRGVSHFLYDGFERELAAQVQFEHHLQGVLYQRSARCRPQAVADFFGGQVRRVVGGDDI